MRDLGQLLRRQRGAAARLRSTGLGYAGPLRSTYEKVGKARSKQSMGVDTGAAAAGYIMRMHASPLIGHTLQVVATKASA